MEVFSLTRLNGIYFFPDFYDRKLVVESAYYGSKLNSKLFTGLSCLGVIDFLNASLISNVRGSLSNSWSTLSVGFGGV